MSLERFVKGSNVKGHPGYDPTKIPSWMDHDKFKRGQEFFQRHATGIFFAVHCSLTLGFVITSFVETLLFTKKSDNAPKAKHRYTKTLAHVVMWHTQNVWNQETLAHQSLQMVVKIHDDISQAMEAQGYKKTFISQFDLAALQSAFMGAVILFPARFGISCRREELDDYIFFWRGIGYLLGIQDEYNLCSGNFDQTQKVCKEIFGKVIYPGLQKPPQGSDILTKAYIDGMNSVVRFRLSTAPSVTSFALAVLEQPQLPSLKLSCGDKVRVFVFKALAFLLRWMPGFEWLFNTVVFAYFNRMKPMLTQEISYASKRR